MANGDYGYFGKGDTGYAQYMTAFNRNFGSSSEMWEKGRSKDSDFPPVCHAAVASGKKIQYNGHRDSMGF